MLNNVNGGLQRHHTVYVKDVLPKKMVANAKKEFLDMNEAVKKQTTITLKCQERLKEKQKELVAYIDYVIMQKNFKELAVLDEGFVGNILTKIKYEEKAIRNQLLGQQESVDILKKAVSQKEADEMYLIIEKEKRTHLTECLRAIVERREIVFSALEYMKRLKIATNCNLFNGLTSLKMEYIEIESLWQAEDDKLQKFTEWEKNPGLLFRKDDKKKS